MGFRESFLRHDVGRGNWVLPLSVQSGIETLPRLVKLDPSFPWARTHPNRIRMMEIQYSGRGALYAEMMQRVAETLDWPALEATMR